MRLALESLTVLYRCRTALAGVSLVVEPGSLMAIVGPNGSGKSSLIRAVAGLVPYEGKVSFDGQCRAPAGRPRLPEHIGYMPQDVSSNAGLTVLETVLLGRVQSLALRVADTDVAAALEVLARLQIADLAERYLGELSGGQRQLAFLAQALVRSPTVMLLDEPIAALDISHQLQVLSIVRSLTRERGLATVMAIHDLNAAARYADAVGVLKGGRLLGVGPPRQILRSGLLAEAFEVDCAIDVGSDGHPLVIPLRHRPG